MTEIDLSAKETIWKEDRYYDSSALKMVTVQTPIGESDKKPKFSIGFVVLNVTIDGNRTPSWVGPIPVDVSSLEEAFRRHEEFALEWTEKRNSKIILPSGLAN